MSREEKTGSKVISRIVDYKHGAESLRGCIAYDDSITGPRPGILIIPEWWGLNQFIKHRAEQLAQLGYVAFAADMYGNGLVTTDASEAQKLAGKFYHDNKLLRQRAQVALDELKEDSRADAKRIAAIGYCFGGTCALELARSGAPLRAVVCFHGSLNTANPTEAGKIKGKVLVCHGGDDSFVPDEQVIAFENEMRKAKVDWQLNTYGGAHHAFSNPDADNFKIPNISYNPSADKRSWQAMKSFFEEVFGAIGK
jgi:dienelactone hydrolase